MSYIFTLCLYFTGVTVVCWFIYDYLSYVVCYTHIFSCMYIMFPIHNLQDGLRLLIQFANHGEYELDANTLDEKNKV